MYAQKALMLLAPRDAHHREMGASNVLVHKHFSSSTKLTTNFYDCQSFLFKEHQISFYNICVVSSQSDPEETNILLFTITRYIMCVNCYCY